MIPYSNMAPFRELGPPENSIFIDAVPSKSIKMLKNGKILAAAAPVGAMPEISDVVEYAGNYGIACKGSVQSVILFSSIPLDKFNKDSLIKITSQTATSVRLLHLLLGYENGFHEIPLMVDSTSSESPGAEGELLIGDEALIKKCKGQSKYIYDLSELWYKKKLLPFVFARWVVRKDAPQIFKNLLNLWLNQMVVQEDSLILKSAHKEANRLNISVSKMISYLRGMNRVIDREAIKGQELFLKDLNRIDSGPLAIKDRPQGASSDNNDST